MMRWKPYRLAGLPCALRANYDTGDEGKTSNPARLKCFLPKRRFTRNNHFKQRKRGDFLSRSCEIILEKEEHNHVSARLPSFVCFMMPQIYWHSCKIPEAKDTTAFTWHWMYWKTDSGSAGCLITPCICGFWWFFFLPLACFPCFFGSVLRDHRCSFCRFSSTLTLKTIFLWT